MLIDVIENNNNLEDELTFQEDGAPLEYALPIGPCHWNGRTGCVKSSTESPELPALFFYRVI